MGGGGATSALSFSPYADLWFVGTDMGTLFRSVDRGQSWWPVRHDQARFSNDLPNAAQLGFNANPDVVFHAPAGLDPLRSADAGEHWTSIDVNGNTSRIRYWVEDPTDPDKMLAATEHGLEQSADGGLTWTHLVAGLGDARGSFLDHTASPATIWHATDSGIWRSDDGVSFAPWHVGAVQAFTGGRDGSGLLLAYLDRDPTACSWSVIVNTLENCGQVHVSVDEGAFVATGQEGGDHLQMARNDSMTLYTTGSRSWESAYGTKVWRSLDRGASFDLIFHQQNWDVLPYAPWPASQLEYSAVGLDVGWWDGGYYHFEVGPTDADLIGGSGNFFIHLSENGGSYWQSAITELAQPGPAAEEMFWRSSGIEVTSVRRLRFHPTDPLFGLAATMDIGGQVTEDGGDSWRISRSTYNAIYDVAFDPANTDRAFIATGSIHDWPHEWHAMPLLAAGGIFETTDRGRTWTHLDPAFNQQFLSVAYDPDTDTVYAGSQISGVARRIAGGPWEWINTGLGAGDLIVPQLEIAPVDGTVYLLLTGDYGTWSTRDRTGVYSRAPADASWTHLRGTVNHPPSVSQAYELWWYPTSFAIDLSPTGDRDTLFLTDQENNGQYLATGVWKSSDHGATWDRTTQYTHPWSVDIDPNNPSRVYASGTWSWGEGGPLYSDDGGDSWQLDPSVPLSFNGNSVTVDPNDPGKVFRTFFGGGMWYGEAP
ncbi:MAG: hypothetical protein GWP91_12360 [Rhodobacterales bacterium]|nr:hypothetical protein [Rhodobacterales bacterium]